MRGVGVKNLIETLLRSEGLLDKRSKVENVLDPSSGMRGVGVKNLIDTLHPIAPLCDDGSPSENGWLHSTVGCTPIRDAWVLVAKPPRNSAADLAFA